MNNKFSNQTRPDSEGGSAPSLELCSDGGCGDDQRGGRPGEGALLVRLVVASAIVTLCSATALIRGLREEFMEAGFLGAAAAALLVWITVRLLMESRRG